MVVEVDVVEMLVKVEVVEVEEMLRQVVLV